MKEITKYVADDGTEFDSIMECQEYEYKEALVSDVFIHLQKHDSVVDTDEIREIIFYLLTKYAIVEK